VKRRCRSKYEISGVFIEKEAVKKIPVKII
jgi:hypothetical protein